MPQLACHDRGTDGVAQGDDEQLDDAQGIDVPRERVQSDQGRHTDHTGEQTGHPHT